MIRLNKLAYSYILSSVLLYSTTVIASAENYPLSPGVAETLANIDKLPPQFPEDSLVDGEFSLHQAGINAEQLMALPRFPANTRKLDLSKNNLKGEAGARAIVEKTNDLHGLEKLDLDYNQLDTVGAQYLANHLFAHHPTLYLDMGENAIGYNGVAAFSKPGNVPETARVDFEGDVTIHLPPDYQYINDPRFHFYSYHREIYPFQRDKIKPAGEE